MIKMRFSTPSYSIEKDGKTTVCVFECKIYDTCTKEVIHQFTVVGKSVCAETDTFNARVGERFAEHMAKKNAYIQAIKFIDIIDNQEVNDMIDSIHDALDALNFYDFMKHMLRVENKHTHKLLKMLE